MAKTRLIDLVEAQEALRRTPCALHDLVHSLPVEAATYQNHPTRSPLQIVCRMRDLEGHWMREVQSLFGKAIGAPSSAPRRSSCRFPTIAEAADAFAQRRDENLAALRTLGLAPADLRRTHPDTAFGVISFRLLLTTWVKHDLVGLAQIARSLLEFYEHEPGSWVRYFSFLTGIEARAAMLISPTSERK